MSLTSAEVAEIMRLVEQSGFDELTLEMDGVKLNLRRGAVAVGGGATATAAAPAPTSPASASATSSSVTAAPAGAATAGGVSIPATTAAGTTSIESPMLGTFYRAPKPGSPPFVEVGSEVVPDTVIAIIEVMKLMNTVRAGVRGTITAILPADGTLVEYGQVLMHVREPA